jgi:cold shock CspA family protein
MVQAVATGRIVRFNEVSGYGFVTPDDGGEDVFLHSSLLPPELKDHLRPGTRVEFEAVPSDRGPKAIGVTILQGAQRLAVDNDDETCEVVSSAEFAQRVTEVLIEVTPTVTGAQISQIRQRLLGYARDHGWIED